MATRYKRYEWMVLSCFLGSASAQVTLDGTLGGVGTLAGPDYAITANLGQQVGNNLFHSFGSFSILQGESATFSGPASISNILGRVTGGQASQINGVVRSTIPGANLYLLNPAGVLFGEQARLNVPGSVHISTADYLRLSDGGRFDAHTPAQSVLTVAPVEAFGFLNDAPSRIEANGSRLRVPRGNTLTFIAGDLSLHNSALYAPDGRMNMVAVASPGEVIPTADGVELRGFNALGTITSTQTTAERPTVDRGKPFGRVEIGNLDTSGMGGGTLFIQGGQWLNQGGWVFADTYGLQDGGRIQADFSGEVRFDLGARLTAATLSAGQGGAVMLNVGTLVLDGGAFVSTAAWDQSQGQGGDLTVNARQAVIITGADEWGSSALSADALDGSTGDAGAIRVTTPVLLLSDSGTIQSGTLGSGSAGQVMLEVDTLTVNGNSYISTSTEGLGNAGTISVDARALTLTGGGGIESVTWGSGQGGNLLVNAHESMTITGASADGNFASGLYAIAGGENATGNAGYMVVTTPQLTLDNGGLMIGEAERTSGGGISINALHLRLLNGSEISSSVYGDALSDGGNVTLNNINFIALNGSSVTAKANQGRGGNITVNAEVFLHDATRVQDVLNASSQRFGNDGTVQNNAPQTDISGSLTVLPARYLDAASQLSRRCGSSDEGERSRFVVRGRGALPLSPDEPLPAQVDGCIPTIHSTSMPVPKSETPTATDPVTVGFDSR